MLTQYTPHQDRQDLVIDVPMIQKYDGHGPRYTSYPTADRFVEAFNADSYGDWLQKRTLGGGNRPLSIYVHVPFCNTICYYCACNKIITKDHGRSAKYIDYVEKEARLVSERMLGSREVRQLHWGGGTPTFLSHDEMLELMAILSHHFKLVNDGEYSIEIDPRKVQPETVSLLAGLGFNRMSIGVQDFDPRVQAAVNRIQSVQETSQVMEAARASGFKSINLDLIYGLPHQTPVTFADTLEKVLTMAPDRLSIYNYAHLPGIFKPQRRIAEADLPTPDAKLAILTLAIERLQQAGYVYIGMDHFARPGDELTIAQQQGRLHRNFQGYSTYAGSDLVALGVSAISKVGPSYSQNVRTLEDYYDRLDAGQLPVLRGVELSKDDLLRQAIIQSLMCHFSVSIEALEIAHLIDFKPYFHHELELLQTFADDGLLDIDDEWLTVTPRGRLLIRSICSVFDRYLQSDRERMRFSRLI